MTTNFSTRLAGEITSRMPLCNQKARQKDIESAINSIIEEHPDLCNNKTKKRELISTLSYAAKYLVCADKNYDGILSATETNDYFKKNSLAKDDLALRYGKSMFNYDEGGKLQDTHIIDFIKNLFNAFIKEIPARRMGCRQDLQ